MPAGSQSVALDPAPKAPFVPESGLIRIRDLIYQVCGIFHPHNRLVFLRDRCLRHLKALGIVGLRDSLDALTTRAGRDEEVRRLVSSVYQS